MRKAAKTGLLFWYTQMQSLMSDQLINAQETFGRTLGRWFALNAWPQSVTEGWAKAVGSEIGPWSSQISPLMRNKILPKPHLFYALGEFNRFVHEKTELSKITDRVLRDRLTHGEALCHADGSPYDGGDFYRLFVGLLTPPEIAEPPKQITEEDVKHCAEVCTSAFRDYALNNMVSPAEAWNTISKALAEYGADDADVEKFRAIVAGWDKPTVEFKKHLHKRYAAKCPLLEVLHDLDGTNEAVELLRKQMREYAAV